MWSALALGAGLRAVVLLPPTERLASLVASWDLSNRLDLSSPVTQWDRLVDDHVFLGEDRRPPPLLFALAALADRRVLQAAVLIGLDVLTAVGLAIAVQQRFARDAGAHERDRETLKVWRQRGRPRLDSDGAINAGSAVNEEEATLVDGLAADDLLSPGTLPATVAALYALSPLGVLACGAKSLFSLPIGLAAWTLVAAQRGNAPLAALLLAMTALVEGPGLLALMAFPVANCLALAGTSRLVFALWLLACLAACLGASVALGGAGFVHSQYVWTALYPEPVPNPGVWWYLFLETFPRFRGYFLLLLNSFAFHLALPLAAHFGHRPELAACLGLAVHLLFHPFCELAALSTAVVLMLMHAEFALAVPFFSR